MSGSFDCLKKVKPSKAAVMLEIERANNPPIKDDKNGDKVTKCDVEEIEASGVAYVPIGQRVLGTGAPEPPTQAVFFGWCKTHRQPAELCPGDDE